MTATLESTLAADVRLVVARLARRIRQQGGTGGLTPSQLATLSALDRLGPTRIGDLAAHEQVTAPTMSRIIGGLEDLGLVTRAQEVDRRASRLSLTAAGRAKVRKLRSERTALLQRRIDALSPDDRRRLVEALPVLDRLLDEERA